MQPGAGKDAEPGNGHEPQPSEIRWISTCLAVAMRGLTGADRCMVILHAGADREELYAMTGHAGWDDVQQSADLDPRHWSNSPFTLPALDELLAREVSTLNRPADSDFARFLLEEHGIVAFITVPLHIDGKNQGLVVAHWTVSEPPTEISGDLGHRLAALSQIAGFAMTSTQRHEQLLWESEHDPITGLPNRHQLESELAERLRHPELHRGLVVACLAVNRFGRVNDMLGREGGDRALRRVGRRLRHLLGDRAIIARTAGSEFIVVLEGHDSDSAIDRALERVSEGFESPVGVDADRVYLKFSFGVSRLVDREAFEEGTDFVVLACELIAEAERNQLARVREDAAAQLGLTSVEELRLDTELHSAIGDEQFFAAYQPQLDLRTGRVVGVEALARWTHPELGAISPLIFIPLAEMNGLIMEIGRLMLVTACRDARRWREQGLDIGVSVNVSGAQLEQPDFADRTLQILFDEAMPPERLTLELTESRSLIDEQPALNHLRRLADLGINIAIDDFGTGFSSLTRLVTLPIAELKIDQSFVQGEDSDSQAVVGAIISLARSLGLEVVGEGVETSEQLQLLRQAGCERAQGYGICKPRGFDQITEFLIERALAAPALP